MHDKSPGPVFILGLHRSGTTLLYEMLAASGCFQVLTARHVVFFDELSTGSINGAAARDRLARRFDELGLTDRGVDRMGLHPDMPEEYGFILHNLGGGWRIRPGAEPVIARIGEMLHRESGAGRRILLKNPFDFADGHVIAALMPGARIVYIHRNPIHVLSSQQNMIAAYVARPSPYLAMLSRRYAAFLQSEFPLRAARLVCTQDSPWLARGVVHCAVKTMRRYLWSCPLVPRQDRFALTYEELCKRPDACIKNILDWLELKGTSNDYLAFIRKQPTSVLPVIASRSESIIRRLTPYVLSVGYNPRTLVDAV